MTRPIVFITREGRHMPGARYRCYSIAQRLRERGFQAEVFSLADHCGAADGPYEKMMPWYRKAFLSFKAAQHMVYADNALFILNRVNYHTVGPYLLSLISYKDIILDIDDWEMKENIQWIGTVYPRSKAEWLTRRMLQKARCAIGASRFLCDFLKERCPNVVYIPSGVDTRRFMPRGENSPSKNITFFWHGTLNRQDDLVNCLFLVACIRRLRGLYPSIFFDIIGDGAYFKALQAKTAHEQHAGFVRLHGWKHPEEISRLIQTYDIGLVALEQDTAFNKSKSPVKLFEMMSCAKPVIASRIGECQLVIQDGVNGFLATGEDAFLDNMRQLCESSERRITMGQRARETIIARYSLDVCVDRFIENVIKMV